MHAEEVRQQPATQTSSTDTAEELRPASPAEKTSTQEVRKPRTRESRSTDTAEDVKPLKVRLRQHVPASSVLDLLLIVQGGPKKRTVFISL